MEGSSGFAWPLSNHSPVEPRGSFEFAKGQPTDGPSTLECLLGEGYRAPDASWQSCADYFPGGQIPPMFPPSSGELPAHISRWPESFSAPGPSPFEGFQPSASPGGIPPWTSAPFPEQGDSVTAITRAFPGQPIVINHYHYHNAQSFDPAPTPEHFPNQHQAVGGQSPPQVHSSPPGYPSPVSNNPSPRYYGSLPSDGYLTRAFNRAESNFNPGYAPTRSVSHSKPLTLCPELTAADSPETQTNYPGFSPNHPLTQVLPQPRPERSQSLTEPVLGAHKRPGDAEGEPGRKRARARSAPPDWFDTPDETEPPGQLNLVQDVPYGKRPDQTAALRELEASWLGPFAYPVVNPFENPVDAGSPVDAANPVFSGVPQPVPINPAPTSQGKEARERSVAVSRAPRLSSYLQGALNRFVTDSSGNPGGQGLGGRMQ